MGPVDLHTPGWRWDAEDYLRRGRRWLYPAKVLEVLDLDRLRLCIDVGLERPLETLDARLLGVPADDEDEDLVEGIIERWLGEHGGPELDVMVRTHRDGGRPGEWIVDVFSSCGRETLCQVVQGLRGVRPYGRRRYGSRADTPEGLEEHLATVVRSPSARDYRRGR